MRRKSSAVLLFLSLAACAGGGEPRAADDHTAQLYQHALQAAEKGEHEKAVRLLTQAIPGLQQPQKTWAHEWRARCHEKLGNINEALADFRRAIELTSELDKARIHCNRGHFLHRLGRDVEAESDYTVAIERQEKHPNKEYYLNFYYSRAKFYFETGRTQECVADCRFVLSLDPDEATRREFEELMQKARRLPQ
ncbi:MAG: tetratricopeptide repeat protein [Planctomycetota bacterium]|jgi:tetratricopeptide (TPR) repeat protein